MTPAEDVSASCVSEFPDCFSSCSVAHLFLASCASALLGCRSAWAKMGRGEREGCRCGCSISAARGVEEKHPRPSRARSPPRPPRRRFGFLARREEGFCSPTRGRHQGQGERLSSRNPRRPRGRRRFAAWLARFLALPSPPPGPGTTTLPLCWPRVRRGERAVFLASIIPLFRQRHVASATMASLSSFSAAFVLPFSSASALYLLPLVVLIRRRRGKLCSHCNLPSTMPLPHFAKCLTADGLAASVTVFTSHVSNSCTIPRAWILTVWAMRASTHASHTTLGFVLVVSANVILYSFAMSMYRNRTLSPLSDIFRLVSVQLLSDYVVSLHITGSFFHFPVSRTARASILPFVSGRCEFRGATAARQYCFRPLRGTQCCLPAASGGQCVKQRLRRGRCTLARPFVL